MMKLGVSKVVDAVTTIALLGTCIVVVATTLNGRSSSASNPNAGPPLPKDPVSINGAKLTGDLSAKVVMIEYSDFQCPYCGRFAREVWPKLRQDYVESGRVLFAYRHFPLEKIHHEAFGAAEVAECAEQQGQFWRVKEAFFANQADIKTKDLSNWVSSLGLNKGQLTECLSAKPTSERVRDDMANGILVDIGSTPSFLVGLREKDGRVRVTRRLKGLQTSEAVQSVLDDLLKEGLGR